MSFLHFMSCLLRMCTVLLALHFYSIWWFVTYGFTARRDFLKLCNLSLLLHCAIRQNYYTYGMCHSYYTVLYIGTIIRMKCVTSIILCNISELLYLWNVSLLLHCALYRTYYTNEMCHIHYTVQYIRTIILMECVTLITPCFISELLYEWNVSPLL